ncbi:MAG: hypothetical protein P4L92_08790 [Rudaea sp.]|nr:hypothetical protein [Rudaea sp.]
MNLYMQLVRGLGALAMCAVVSAYALTQPIAADGQEVAVAHSRLLILSTVGADSMPRYQVASVRVGEPVPLPDQTRRVAQHTRLSSVHG